jgi:hypothetical protein
MKSATSLFILKHKTKYIYLVLFCCITTTSQAQFLEGQISDSIGKPLQNANVIARTIGLEKTKTTFSISDAKGNYQVALQPAIPHQISITYLGFKKLADTIQIEETITKNYTLYESTETLEEVIVQREMAMIVKQDTIVYRVDNFKTGNERKLRDILKNLPGVEVDREGNVKVNGKKVTKLTIEGREFFTGDPKLGVLNIPADAVKEIEALDNDPEVAFLKGLDDSDKMTLNIKLKEGKKNFAFGESEVGVGHKDRYYVNPNLFYYSPNTSANVLGDFNNIGEAAFTMSDYFNFEGGFSAMTQGRNTFKRTYSQDAGTIFGSMDFIDKTSNFGAGSLSQRLGRFTFLDVYSIVKQGQEETRTSQEINYLTQEQVNENRDESGFNETLASLSKIKLRYDNINDIDFITDFVVKYLDAQNTQNTISNSPQNQQFFNADEAPRNLEVANTFSFNKSFSYRHKISINTNLQYLEQENTRDWLFDQPIFTNLIPFEDEGNNFNFTSNEASQAQVAQLDVKHYWVLNNTNHLYPIGGINYLNKNFSTFDFQQLEDGSINSFETANFNNDLDFQLMDVFAGVQYKFMVNKWIFRPGAVFRNYRWNASQFGDEIVADDKWIFQPEFMMKKDFSMDKKLRVDYNLNSDFAQANQFANRLRLQNFNNVFLGNEDLENELYHDLRIRYETKFYPLKININTNFNFISRLETIRPATEIDGIDFVSTSILTDLPEDTYNLGLGLSRGLGKLIFLNFNTSANFSNYDRFLNQEQVSFNSNAYSYNLRTTFREFKYNEVSKLPEITFIWQHSITETKSSNEGNPTQKFQNISPSLDFKWRFLNDFVVSADYKYTYFKNETTANSNTFEVGNASLFYQQESSPWGFGLDVTNIFDIGFKRNNSLNEFLVMDSRTFIQPRIFIVKVSYQL